MCLKFLILDLLWTNITFITNFPLKLVSGNKWWSIKVAAKLLPDIFMFSILSSDISLDFHNSTWVVPLKELRYFLVAINTKWSWNILKENYSAPLRLLNLSIKSFVNPLTDIALTFSIVHLIHFYLT